MISVTNIRYVFTVWSPDFCSGSTFSFLCGATTVLEISCECEKYSWQVHRGKVNRVNCSNNSRGIPPIYFCVRYLLKKLCHSIIYLAVAAQDTKLAERVIAWPFQGCFRQCDLNDPSGVKTARISRISRIQGFQGFRQCDLNDPSGVKAGQVCNFWWIGGQGNTTAASPSLSSRNNDDGNLVLHFFNVFLTSCCNLCSQQHHRGWMKNDQPWMLSDCFKLLSFHKHQVNYEQAR